MNREQHEIVKYKGIVKDIEPLELMEVPVWTSGLNVHFDDGSTHRVGGYARFADPLDTTPAAVPVFIHPVLLPDSAYWIYIDDDGLTVQVMVTDGVSHWDITPVGGLTVGGAGIWTGCTLNSIPVLNNGIDPPFWWDGATGTPCTTLPDWPVDQRCKSIRAFKFHLIALNLTRGGVQFPHMLAWSSAADSGTIPTSWTPLPENDAGDASLAEELGGIIDAQPLRSSLYIFRQHSTSVADYIAGQYVFTFRELFNTSGIQALNCAVEVRGKLYVTTDDDIIVTDGNTFHSIADNMIRNAVFSGIQPENHGLCCVEIRTDKDEVWFCFPDVDSTYLNAAAIWSLEDEVWGFRQLPDVAFVKTGIIPREDFDRTWDGAIPIWQDDPRRWNDANYSITSDGLLMADPLGSRLLNVDAISSNDGEPVNAYAERVVHVVGGQEEIWQNALTRSIFPYVTGTEGDEIQIRVGAARNTNSPTQWGPTQTFTIGEPIKVDSIEHGRYLSIRFSSSGGDPWQIHRFGIEYVQLGRY